MQGEIVCFQKHGGFGNVGSISLYLNCLRNFFPHFRFSQCEILKHGHKICGLLFLFGMCVCIVLILDLAKVQCMAIWLKGSALGGSRTFKYAEY